MKLDPTVFRYITKDEFRVLTAVEIGMRNHELVPAPLIESIAKVSRACTFKILQSLLRNRLLAHDGKKYDGYRMTYHGYDFLALRALAARGTIVAVGRRLGVGKESDVHYCQGPEGEVLALKLHRLGRISFRAIKAKRDYLQHREHASWMYMARLAALKEFAYMKALRDEGFPVPLPVDQNRHAVVMSFVDGVPLSRVRELEHPQQVLERLMRLLVRLARAGIVHGDFNEFNLMIGAEEKVTLIDFPQIVHLNHANAAETFDRDVRSTCDFFRKRLNLEIEKWPTFDEVMAEVRADGVEPALGAAPAVQGLSRRDDALLVAAHEEAHEHEEEQGSDSEAESNDEPGGEDVDPEAQSRTALQGFEQLLPTGGQEALMEELEIQDGAEPTAGGPISGNHDDGAPAPSEDDASGSSDSEVSEAPGQVRITSGRRTRKKQTAKEARKNLQRQQNQRPAKPNNQKAKDLRRAKHEIREHFS
mmetsp:Transcript_978/g.2967  ORF Transcript_978/g.2967 Transcript_978/m.2967 type:complete len:476 (+) Transcript_978:100-1527(+)